MNQEEMRDLLLVIRHHGFSANFYEYLEGRFCITCTPFRDTYFLTSREEWEIMKRVIQARSMLLSPPITKMGEPRQRVTYRVLQQDS